MGDTTTYCVPFGKGELEFQLRPDMRGEVAESLPAPPLKDIKGAVELSLAQPIKTPALKELSNPEDRVCIVFTDITRASPDHVMVPALLAELESAGVRDENITLLCGIGMHRPSTPEEKMVKLGEEVVKRYRVLDHEPRNPDVLVDLGMTETGIPLSVNRIAYESDLLIATGIVEPHQYAGYSGGRKTLAIGAAGEAMIAFTHGPKLAEHPDTRLGRIEGNPFHEIISEAANRAGLRFILNAVMDEKKRIVAVSAGKPETTFLNLVKTARGIYEVPIPHPYDVAIAGVGFPKDANIYQASRSASYLFFAPTSVVKEGGVIIVPAPTPEGAGDGVGEKRFFEKMRQAHDMSSLLEELRRTGYPPGAQRAFIMAKVLEKVDVIFVGSETPDLVRKLHMLPVQSMDEALKLAQKKCGRDDLDVLIVPHALLTLPIVSNASPP
jgi:nickel-dependent lactate racemase